MNEIQDLKNHILALDQKINNIMLIIQSFNKNNDNINEVVNMIHNLGLERSKQNTVIFETIYPDLIRRITSIENVHREQIEAKNKLEIESKSVNDILSIDIGKLDFNNNRVLHCLRAENIKTIGCIMKKSAYDLLKIPNFGKKSLRDLNEALSKYDLKVNKYNQVIGY